MSTRSLEAWVLHKQWTGDTSARVVFFSRELGLISGRIQGGRTPKKQAILHAFTPLWISLMTRYDSDYVRTVESSSPSLVLTGNSLFAGLYINEILYFALALNDANPALFDAYIITLKGLVVASDQMYLEALLRRFEWSLLKACGCCFSLSQEARTAQLIAPDMCYRFVAGEGFVFDKLGIPGEHILALAQDNLTEAVYLKSAKKIMRQAIDYLVGGRAIKARSLYSK